MENTGEILFGDDLPQWYVAVGERWVGPLTASEVYERILKGEFSWAHFVWKQGDPAWKRICDTETFQAAVPNAPSPRVLDQVKETARPTVKAAPARKSAPTPPPPIKEEKSWFLHYNNSQYGPFAESEVSRYLTVGKIHGRVFGWKEGMATWERLERIPIFSHESSSSKQSHPERVEKKRSDASAPKETAVADPKGDLRRAPRRPIVARILMAKGESLLMGVCRDISVGGMQVLTEQIPGPAGTRIKLNVSPSTPEANIQPFVADGVVVRILEDGRGFSFRFDRLPEDTRRAIESYFSDEF
jgi:hypothetical protein